MTLNPESQQFIRHELPAPSEKHIQICHDVYNLLSVSIKDHVWPGLSSNDLTVEYNDYTGRITISVHFADQDNHNHWFSCEYTHEEGFACEYRFDPTFSDEACLYAYVEWLMTELLNSGYNPISNDCDTGLWILANDKDPYDIIQKMLDIVTNNIKLIDWFLETTPCWKYEETYNTLVEILPMIQDEAHTNRWENVDSDNFIIEKDKDKALIVLEYTDDINFAMKFCIGLYDGIFREVRSDAYIYMFYEFKSLSGSEEVKSYYQKQNLEFLKHVNALLEAPFYWKSLLFHGDDNFYIRTFRYRAFQKFCLMLDCVLPLKDLFRADEPLITSEMMRTKEKLENALPFHLEITPDDDSLKVFSKGHFKSRIHSKENYEEFHFFK